MGKRLVHLIYFDVNVAAITIIPQHDVAHDPTASITSRRSPSDLDLGCALLYNVGCVETLRCSAGVVARYYRWLRDTVEIDGKSPESILKTACHTHKSLEVIVVLGAIIS